MNNDLWFSFSPAMWAAVVLILYILYVIMSKPKTYCYWCRRFWYNIWL